MKSIVVTSISAPNPVLTALAQGAQTHGFNLIVIGDKKSPSDFVLDGCQFVSVEQQLKTQLSFAQLCPCNHYARKNIGYLLAIRDGSQYILETDDDNYPRTQFFTPRSRTVSAPTCRSKVWVNAYRYFTDHQIWPRGLPLDWVNAEVPGIESLATEALFCPIQQGLADENPDVDAIYRLILPLPVSFEAGREIILAGGWCPFNSQNTLWWPEAYPLLYLPAYCSFRMTDIWRSFVAQRICWENGWGISFFSSTVWQDRNEHRLMKDFEDEVSGYLHNSRIRNILEGVTLKSGVEALADNLRICYSALVRESLLAAEELSLLDAWLSDLKEIER
jgi:hypothetical protein